MPAIRSLISERCTLLISSIIFNSEIMSPYFCYIKKGLVYVIIADLSGCQSSFYSKYTKLNTYALYNILSVSLNKCMFFIYLNSL